MTICISLVTFSQAQIPPQAFNYSAVARNSSGQPISASTIGIQITILKTSSTGISVYSENHFVNTDVYGLFNLIVGAGAIQNGSISTIDWSSDSYYLKVELDANGGTNFLTMGTTQLLSVPYALHAATADSLIGGIPNFSGNYSDLTNTPNLSSVAISGDYSDLTNQPVTINSISSNGDTLYLSNGQVFISAFTPTNLSSFTNDIGYLTINNDNDSTNEIQQLLVSTQGDTLYLQNGGHVIIPGISASNYPALFSSITTNNIANVTNSGAISGGNAISNGGYPITQRGICWNTAPNPTLSNFFTNNGAGPGNYVSYLTGLSGNSNYYVRAYITTSAGTNYGNELSFTTSNGGSGIVTNPGAGVTFDGYAYSSIVLGNGQEWISENLRTTKYANGDDVVNVQDALSWSNLSTGAWALYNNDSQYESPFGKLYNWYAVSDSRNLCPSGWHVPSNADWTVLTDYLGGESVAGGKLKQTGITYWLSPNFAGNESGFSALPSGIRGINGEFQYFGSSVIYWTSTENLNLYMAYRKHISNAEIGVATDSNYKTTGFSVRCVKD